MPTRELTAGQDHTFPSAALRVNLTGAPGGGVRLMVVDQAGYDTGPVRLTDVMVVLTPAPRRLRLVAVPAADDLFAPATNLGLTVKTEGGGDGEQVLVSPVDVGALAERELAIIEFATDRAILRVPGAVSRPLSQDRAPVVAPAAAPGQPAPAAPAAPAPPTVPPPKLEDMPWLGAGRYALREARQLGGAQVSDASGLEWGVVLDTSASMAARAASGELSEVLALVLGICLEWTGRLPAALVTSGVARRTVSPVGDPSKLITELFSDREPSSWATLADPVSELAQRVGLTGAVLIVSDGVPGDVGQLTEIARRQPGVRFMLVGRGRSTHGLPSDTAGRQWWEEELTGIDEWAALPNVVVASLAASDAEGTALDERHRAELALRLTQGTRVIS